MRAATGQRTSAGNFSAGMGFIKMRAGTPKHTAKKSAHHQRPPPRSIFGGFQHLKWEIHLNELIDAGGNRAANVGGRFQCRDGVYKNSARAPQNMQPKISTSSKASPSVNIWRISTSEVGKSI
jgi:hypothetical protein